MAKTVRVVIRVTAAVALVLLEARSGYSQYQPAYPTVSPYLNLFNSNNGFLPNYHTYVRPLQNQQQVNRRLEEANRRLEKSNQSQSNAFGVNSAVQGRPTGVHSQFRSYSHFYSPRSSRTR